MEPGRSLLDEQEQGQGGLGFASQIVDNARTKVQP